MSLQAVYFLILSRNPSRIRVGPEKTLHPGQIDLGTGIEQVARLTSLSEGVIGQGRILVIKRALIE